MFEPSSRDFLDILECVQAKDEDELYSLIDDMGLPEERAAHFYSYCAEVGADATLDSIQQAYNKAWQ